MIRAEEGARVHVENATHPNPGVEDYVVGPALLLAYVANAITWVFFVVYPLFAYYFIRCRQHHFSSYPKWLWIPFFLTAAILLILEVKASCYTLGAQLFARMALREEKEVSTRSLEAPVAPQSPGSPESVELPSASSKFELPSGSYKRWLLIVLIVSFIFKLDVFTTGIFVARSFKTDYCLEKFKGNMSAGFTPEQVWTEVLKVSSVPEFVQNTKFSEFVVFGWLIVLTQPIYALLYSIPRSPELQEEIPFAAKKMAEKWLKKTSSGRKQTGDAGSQDPSEAASENPPLKKFGFIYSVRYDKVTGGKPPQYEVFMRPEQMHGRALQGLADSARMNAVCALDPEYLKVAIKDWHPQRVYHEMRRINMRFLLFLLESIIPPNLQATYIGLEKAMSRSRSDFMQTQDYYTFCSVVLSVVVGFLYIWGEFGNIEKLYTEIFTKGRNRKYRGQLRREVWSVEKAKIKVRGSWWFAFFVSFVGMCCLFYALLKAIMAMYVCEYGVWNLHWPLEHGCLSKYQLGG